MDEEIVVKEELDEKFELGTDCVDEASISYGSEEFKVLDDCDYVGDQQRFSTPIYTTLPPSTLPKTVSTEVYSDSTIVAEVQGRLNLGSISRVFDVTKGELLRRLAPPECMSCSSLASLLRRAKTKSSGANMRQELAQYGLPMSTNRRSGGITNTFSALCEEEAHQLVVDLDKSIKQNSLSSQFSKFLLSVLQNEEGFDHLKNDLVATRRILSRCSKIVRMADNPVLNNQKFGLIDPELQDQLNILSSLTHGFFNDALLTYLSLTEDIIKHTEDRLSQSNYMATSSSNQCFTLNGLTFSNLQ